MPWRPPWTRFVVWLDNFNHPYDKPHNGRPGTHYAPRSDRLCAFFDWITNYWCHD